LPIEFGIDEAEQQYNNFVNNNKSSIKTEEHYISEEKASAKQLLEETIWSCLVNRK
jgi:hypothetical protein